MVVWLCFEAHRSDGYVWSVRAGNTWLEARAIRSYIPLETHYVGPDGKQPKAYLWGQANDVQQADNGTITIT